MENTIHEAMLKAIEKAEEEDIKASYLAESGSNPGIRKMNSNKAEWLRWVVYLAKLGFEAEKMLSKSEVSQEPNLECAECLSKDKLIADLTTVNEQLKDQLSTATRRVEVLQDTCDCEVGYQKELAIRTKIDWYNEIINKAYDRCWLDGTVLVCPVDYLDHCLLELVKE